MNQLFYFFIPLYFRGFWGNVSELRGGIFRSFGESRSSGLERLSESAAAVTVCSYADGDVDGGRER